MIDQENLYKFPSLMGTPAYIRHTVPPSHQCDRILKKLLTGRETAENIKRSCVHIDC